MFVSTKWRAAGVLLLMTQLLTNVTGTNYNPVYYTSDSFHLESQVLRALVQAETSEQSLTICRLQPGEQYHLSVFNPLDAACTIGMSPADPTVRFLSREKNKVSFVALDSCATINVFFETRSLQAMMHFSLGCMTCSSQKPEQRSGSIDVDKRLTAVELIRDVFIGGDCFDVNQSSIVYTGDNDSRAFFDNGDHLIEMEEGIILTTGNANTVRGPNLYFDASTQHSAVERDDPDLQAIIGSGLDLYDVAALEFDFTPTTDQISFDFVFASEEYCEYAGSAYNDVFGFFISGPGINGPFTDGAENIALIPNTTDYITINNLNHYSNTDYYNNNVPGFHHWVMPFGLSCDNHTRNSGDNVDEFEYDGFTTPLTATASVQACETYHIKLIVADVNDGYYDSAVFLKANSFNAGSTALVDTEVPGLDDNIAYEGCTEGQFVFRRTNNDLTEDMTVRYRLSTASTATPGVDYAALPDSIVIPAGDSILVLPVTVFEDGQSEGIENIILDLEAPCSCTMPFIEFKIGDGSDMQVQLDDQQICDAQPVQLTPDITGGVLPYTYRWNTGDTTPTINVQPAVTTNYQLTVTDYCGTSVMIQNEVFISVPPIATILGYESICSGKPQITIPIEFTGTGPWSVIYRRNGKDSVRIDDITVSPYLLSISETGTYDLAFVTAPGCEGSVRGAATVFETVLELDADVEAVTCPGKKDGIVQLAYDGGTAPYEFDWGNGWKTNDRREQLDTGRYQVLVKDRNGCSEIIEVEVGLAASIPVVNAGIDTTLTCDRTELNLQGSGSSGANYQIDWTTTDGNILTNANTFSPTINQPGTYQLNILNTQTNCLQSDQIVIVADTIRPIPLIIVEGPQTLDCNTTSTVLNGLSSRPFNRLDFLWTTNDGEVQDFDKENNSLEISQSGNYQLLVTDQKNGCSASQTISIDNDTIRPEINIQPPDPITCTNKQITIDAINSSQGSDFTYSWSTIYGNITSPIDQATLNVSQSADYTLQIINQKNGCQNEKSVFVAIDTTTPTLFIDVFELLDCNTPEVEINASINPVSERPYNFAWRSPDRFLIQEKNTLNPRVTQPGIYILEAKNLENGCTSTIQALVEEDTNRPTKIMIQMIPPLCFGDPGTLLIDEVRGGEEPYLFSITTPTLFQTDTFFTLPPGDYTIQLQDLNGCELAQQISIPEIPPLVLTLGDDKTIRLGESVRINTQSNVFASQLESIVWLSGDSLDCNDCLNPLARPHFTNNYQLLITDKNGCTATDELLIKVDDERLVYIPNAFTPNGDGHNDRFSIYAFDPAVKQINKLSVYSRWGEQVFELQQFAPNDNNAGWDGTFKGEQLNPGAYIYWTEIEFIDGHHEIFKGDITLLR